MKVESLLHAKRARNKCNRSCLESSPCTKLLSSLILLGLQQPMQNRAELSNKHWTRRPRRRRAQLQQEAIVAERLDRS
jgi:hypothetical protein